jgi:hypothetical protein
LTKSITENTKENQVFGSGNGKKASLFGPKKRRIGQILCLEERTHEHDPFTKTSKTSCCDTIKTLSFIADLLQGAALVAVRTLCM